MQVIGFLRFGTLELPHLLRIFAFKATVNESFKPELFKYLTIQLIGFPSNNILFPDLIKEIAGVNKPS